MLILLSQQLPLLNKCVKFVLNNALEKPNLSDEDASIAPKTFGYAILGVMATTFALMGFSMTIIIFLVLIGYFVWRAVARTEMHEVRGIFEFYLQANEVLRDDERRWYGFEVQNVISRGQRILGMMPDAPPLVHFTLGALHHRIGNFQQAENHFAFLLEDEMADERRRMSASSELKSYVRILRKLEREPAEAPQTTAALRALERARRHRAAVLLQESRAKIQEAVEASKVKELKEAAPKLQEPLKPLLERLEETQQPRAEAVPQIQEITIALANDSKTVNGNGSSAAVKVAEQSINKEAAPKSDRAKKPNQAEMTADEKARQSISEVLRDIYD